MSGIAGIIHFDGRPVEPGQIEAMTAAMHYRGPDGIHHWRRGKAALGQCMLRTTPESLEEAQPLTNEDESLVLVMDGRVDNFEDLRRELLGKGAILRTRADAELVLRAYEVWGEDCPDRIVGECVFFIWDARQQRLFAARDAAGTRHFYYHQGKGWFAFASEIAGLLSLKGIEARLNESRLLDYLVAEFDRDDEVGTFYQHILRMPAGHAMVVTERGPRMWRYWSPGDLAESHFASIEECTEAFLAQFRIVVRCRLRSIGPIGAMLSGGLDSSSIVALISKEFRSDLRESLRTFSLIRKDRENCSDWIGVQEMLRDQWIDPMILTSDIASDMCESYLANIKNLDEPFALSDGLTDALVIDAVRESGCQVVLDGMAGDLLFYSPPASMDRLFRRKAFSQFPAILAAYKRHGIEGGLRRAAWISLRTVAPEKMLAAYRKLRGVRELVSATGSDVPGNLANLLHWETARQYLTAKHSYRQRPEALVKSGSDQADHARNFTAGLLSFAHEVNGQIALSKGVEPRSPFSDRRMIEFAIQMPLEAKLSRYWYKRVLRDSMVGVVPESVRWRHTVGEHPGWSFFEKFISSMGRSAPELWSSAGLEERLKKWINSAELRRTWNRYQKEGDFCSGYNVLALAILALWLESHAIVLNFHD